MAVGGVVAAALFIACSSETTTPGTPLAVTQTAPVANATGVDLGTAVSAMFNQALDSSSISSLTVQAADTLTLPTATWYSSADHIVHLSGPFGPGSSYRTTIEPGIRSATHEPLGTAYSWTFSTRSVQAATVDTFDASYVAIALDHANGVHVVYLAPYRSYLRYAECPATCTVPGNWDSTQVDLIGADLYGSTTGLVIDPGGRLHTVYYSRATMQIKYATCAALCASSANWSTTAIDTSFIAPWLSLGQDGGGRLHVSYTNGDLRYATCSAACTSRANWTLVTVDPGQVVGDFSSLAVDATGRISISYYDAVNGRSKFATCSTGCTMAANWQYGIVDTYGTHGVVVTDPTNAVHVIYDDQGVVDSLRIASCTRLCTDSTHWRSVSIDAINVSSIPYPAVVIDAVGRFHIAYFSLTRYAIEYATCAALCTARTSWRFYPIGTPLPGKDETPNALSVDPTGRVRVVFTDGRTIYIE
jgi:hypothetical protein